MRTPPLVPPTGRRPDPYKPTLFDRHGPDAGLRIKAAGYAAMVFVLTLVMWNVLATRKLGMTGFRATLFSLVAAAVSAALSFRMGLAGANAAGGVARTVTMGSGSTPYEEQFSYQESLAARGDVVGALESYEAVIAERADAVLPRLKAAALYARKGGNPGRAAALLREARELPGVTPRDALYASLRLVDLYEGPLGDPGRALVELRRLVELHPDSEVAAGARTAIARLKAQRAAEQNDR